MINHPWERCKGSGLKPDRVSVCPVCRRSPISCTREGVLIAHKYRVQRKDKPRLFSRRIAGRLLAEEFRVQEESTKPIE